MEQMEPAQETTNEDLDRVQCEKDIFDAPELDDTDPDDAKEFATDDGEANDAVVHEDNDSDSSDCVKQSGGDENKASSVEVEQVVAAKAGEDNDEEVRKVEQGEKVKAIIAALKTIAEGDSDDASSKRQPPADLLPLTEYEIRRREELRQLKMELSGRVPIQAKLPGSRKMSVSGGAALKTGYLVKCGGSRKTWKKRYFVLRPNLLYYYTKPRDKNPRGVIPLDDCCVERSIDISYVLGRTHCFRIFHPQRRIYFIQASNEDEMKIWMSAVESAIRATPVYNVAQKLMNITLNPAAKDEPAVGWLASLRGIDKQGTLLCGVDSRRWVSRVYALKGTCLYEFASAKDDEPRSAIDIRGYIIQRSDARPNAFRLSHTEDGRLNYTLAGQNNDDTNEWLEAMRDATQADRTYEVEEFDSNNE